MRRNRPQSPREPQPERPAPRSRKPKPGTPREAAAPTEDQPGVRLNRYIAQAGVCSRRKADELILAGLVKIDGETVTELGTRVQDGQAVEANGKLISPRGHVYVLLNKPEDVITTTDDEKGRSTVLDLVTLPKGEKAGLFPVGRLDRDTSGVLLLTNDGDLAHRLMHPSYEIDKLYRVRTRMPLKPHELDTLRRGVMLEDGEARADEAAYLDPDDHREVGLRLHEGRNRQIRRMLEVLGHEVLRLERVNYAGLTSEGLRRGRWRRLTTAEVQRLRRKVKLR